MVRLARRVLPVAPAQELEHFFTRVDGRRMVTPLFIALLAVEFTDLIFAVDSIPAVLAVSRNPFIVFTSNVFAILGLRALYFLVSGSRVDPRDFFGLAAMSAMIRSGRAAIPYR